MGGGGQLVDEVIDLCSAAPAVPALQYCAVILHETPHNARSGCVPGLWIRLPALSHTTQYKDCRSGQKDSLASIVSEPCDVTLYTK